MKKRLLFFVVLILSIASTVFAADYQKNHFFKQLQSLNDSCILSVKEGKYYLDVNRISVGSEGIFLISDYFGPLALTHLMYDSEGMYTLGIYGHWKCDGCGRWYNYQPAECSKCGSTSFTWVDDLPDTLIEEREI